jgi:hypothetical protein
MVFSGFATAEQAAGNQGEDKEKSFHTGMRFNP